MLGRSSIIYGGSLLLHAGVALSVAAISPEAKRESTRITIRETKRPEAKPDQPAPAPPPPAAPAPVAAPAPIPAPMRGPKKAPRAEAAPSATAAVAVPAGPAVPMFGLTLSGGVGSGGVAVPAAAPPVAATPSVTKTAAAKSLVRPKSSEPSCSEELSKPKPLRVPQPVYPAQARESGIAGKVRVELTLDARGGVVRARVLEGLGHGLDEAALEAARSAQFEPATRCGQGVETTFVIGMRFSL